MKRVLAALLLIGCPTPTSMDAGMEEPDASYMGGTTGGAIPIVPDPDPEPDEDGGDIVVDNRCCELFFAIPDMESSDTTGRLVGTYGPVASDGGVPLVRDGGTWSAAACLPVGESIQYWFELTEPSDAGDVVTVRYDENAPSTSGFGGSPVNVFGPVSDCSAVDAGTGTWP